MLIKYNDGFNQNLLSKIYIRNKIKAAFVILLLLILNLALGQSREQDSLALVALYNSTDGANWFENTNWLSSEPIDNWFGITIIDERVTKTIS